MAWMARPSFKTELEKHSGSSSNSRKASPLRDFLAHDPGSFSYQLGSWSPKLELRGEGQHTGCMHEASKTMLRKHCTERQTAHDSLPFHLRKKPFAGSHNVKYASGNSLWGANDLFVSFHNVVHQSKQPCFFPDIKIKGRPQPKWITDADCRVSVPKASQQAINDQSKSR